jgi:hypothetical protein
MPEQEVRVMKRVCVVLNIRRIYNNEYAKNE